LQWPDRRLVVAETTCLTRLVLSRFMGIFEGFRPRLDRGANPTECYPSANRQSLIFDGNRRNTLFAVRLYPRSGPSIEPMGLVCNRYLSDPK
jgi:hypothetical protein